MCFDVVFEPVHSYVSGDDSNGSLDRLLDRIFFRSSHIDPVIETKFCGRNKKIGVRKRKSTPAARENARRIVTKTIETERANWSRAIDRPWRVTVEKTGEHGVSSVELGQDFGLICTENMPERGGEADMRTSPVSMADYELEVLILLSHPGRRGTADGIKPEMGRPPTAVFGAAVQDGDEQEKADGGKMKASRTTTEIANARVLRTDVGNLEEDLWCFGIRLRRPCLLEKRGLEVAKTNFSVAASLCLLMLREQKNNLMGELEVTVLDPMCGHGTLPLVMHLMQQKVGRVLLNLDSGGESKIQEGNPTDRSIFPLNKRRCAEDGDPDQEKDATVAKDKVDPLPPFKLIGCDTKDLSYAKDISIHFRDSLLLGQRQIQPQPTPTAVHIRPPTASWIGSTDTCRLQLCDSTIDCLIVDPPWGQRHGSHTFVEKNLRKWLFEWCRVVKVGGLLGIVTIRTNQMVRELAIEPFARNLVALNGFPLMFHNCGYSQCMFFLLRKVG